jgi:hypothetical protein
MGHSYCFCFFPFHCISSPSNFVEITVAVDTIAFLEHLNLAHDKGHIPVPLRIQLPGAAPALYSYAESRMVSDIQVTFISGFLIVNAIVIKM